MFRKKKDKTRREQVVKEKEYEIPKKQRWLSLFFELASLVLATISVVLTFFANELELQCKMLIIAILVIMIMAWTIVRYMIIVRENKVEKKYMYYFHSAEISKSLLTAVKRTHFSKTTAILQSTYGHVPDWHPINICDNVLAYDIHEYLRRICIGLKEIIVNLDPEDYSDDMVTVDIAFEYPYDKELCANNNRVSCCFEKQHSDQDDSGFEVREEKDEGCSDWKIITSGDHTSNRVSLHNYLNDYNSFYSHLKSQGYVFGNDKEMLEKDNHYIWTSKDREYNRIGSIVGEVIELRNDNPEATFVRAYLTISTYGRRFVEKGDELDLESFQKIFKETVINYYKTIIETELAQMFIRHGVREGFINRRNGKLYLKEN